MDGKERLTASAAFHVIKIQYIFEVIINGKPTYYICFVNNPEIPALSLMMAAIFPFI